MLRSLQVRNYVLIDSLDIEFPAGLVIITGPTGAGKSILLGALSMLLGGKADSSMLGSAGGNCVVEAEFDSASDSILEDMVEKAGLDWNGGVLTIRRVLSASGRSRAFVNDEPVNMSVLTELSSRLIDIHSQHQTLILKDKAFQLSLLDHYAGNGSLLSSYTLAWKELQSINARLQELGATLRKMALEKDYNEAQFTQLDQARLQEGELEALEAEQKMLANAGQIKEGLYAVSSMLAPEEGASTDSLLKESVRSLERVGRYVPEASALASRLESVRLETEDILSETQTLGDGIDVSAERLSQVEERMSLLYGLLKKHACSTVAELMAVRDSLSELLYDSDALEAEKNKAEARKARLEKELGALALKLHESRTGAASGFAAAIQESLRSLELEHSVFDVAVSKVQQNATGEDAVTFLFSSSGAAPVEVARCASGGELSRIMLSLKAMMARYTAMPSMVFDEIDTGVSGSAADSMGSMICRMGEDMQVFAITHLPQVAAKGHSHFLVSKSLEEGRAVTEISRIEGERRVEEIARMLSGSDITPQAMENARVLLGKAAL